MTTRNKYLKRSRIS